MDGVRSGGLADIGDDLLELVAGGAMTDQDKERFLEAIRATKSAGMTLDGALDALEQAFGEKRPEDLPEYREFMIQNW